MSTTNLIDGPLPKAIPAALLPPSGNGVVHSHFSVKGDAGQSFRNWQERMGPVYDVQPPSARAMDTFHASVTRHSIEQLSLLEIHTGANLAVRSLARVSTESIDDISFSLFLEGRPAQYLGGRSGKASAPPDAAPAVLALDMAQACTIHSFDSRMLLLFAPRKSVEKFIPDASSLHGRWLRAEQPLLRLLCDHLLAVRRDISVLSAKKMQADLDTALQILVTAYGRQAGLDGNGQAAVRAAVYAQVRRHVQSRLHDPMLSPESVLESLHLSRASVYRIFQEDGGIATYIRNQRLRAAARQLMVNPRLDILPLAFNLGFNDASTFSRAFRMAFDITPRDLRKTALEQPFNLYGKSRFSTHDEINMRAT